MGGIFSSSKEECRTNHPELIERGSTFFFKDGATKGYGKVLDLVLDDNFNKSESSEKIIVL